MASCDPLFLASSSRRPALSRAASASSYAPSEKTRIESRSSASAISPASFVAAAFASSRWSLTSPSAARASLTSEARASAFCSSFASSRRLLSAAGLKPRSSISPSTSSYPFLSLSTSLFAERTASSRSGISPVRCSRAVNLWWSSRREPILSLSLDLSSSSYPSFAIISANEESFSREAARYLDASSSSTLLFGISSIRTVRMACSATRS